MKLAKSISTRWPIAHACRPCSKKRPGALLERRRSRARSSNAIAALTLGDAAHGLVQDVRDHEQRQLQQRVGTTLRQPAQARCAAGALRVPAEDPGKRQQDRRAERSSRNIEQKTLAELQAEASRAVTKCAGTAQSCVQHCALAARSAPRARPARKRASTRARCPGRSARTRVQSPACPTQPPPRRPSPVGRVAAPAPRSGPARSRSSVNDSGLERREARRAPVATCEQHRRAPTTSYTRQCARRRAQAQVGRLLAHQAVLVLGRVVEPRVRRGDPADALLVQPPAVASRGSARPS